MGNKNIKQYYFNIILLFVFISFSFSSDVIEIPLKPLHVKGIPKFNNIKMVEPTQDDEENQLNNRFLIEEGNTLINTNLLFIGNIRIGSNKQQFNLILDTGSIILWVAQKGSSDAVPINNHYDPWASNTCKNTNIPFEQAYITGKCSGTYYSDNVNYVNNRDFLMFFGVATRTEFPETGGDGIIGLGHYYLDENLSFIKMLNKGGATSSTMFSFKFGNDINVGTNGKLYIGKHDDFNKNNVVTCPLIKQGDLALYWTCEVNSFGLKNSGNEIRSNRKFGLVFDTGTNVMILPLEYLVDLQNQINKFNCFFIGSQDQTSYQIACPMFSDWPDLSFEINGHYLTVPKHYFFYQAGQYVYSRVIFQQTNFYILGTPFFFTFHTLFDKDSETLYFYPENSQYVVKKNYLDLKETNEDEKVGNILNLYSFCIILGLILLSIGTGLILYYTIKLRNKDNIIKNNDDKTEKIISSNNNENTIL